MPRAATPFRLFLLCCWLLLPAGPAAAAAQPLGERARMLLDYQSFMRGDRDGGVRFLITASRDFQGTPLAELAVRIALLYEPAGLAAVNTGEAEARRILASETELAPEYRDALRRFVGRSLAAAGRREEAMELHRRRGLAMSWLLAGPFRGRRAAGFNSREFPEAGEVDSRDPLANPPDAARLREWRRNPPWRKVPENRAFPYIRPWQWSGGEGSGAMLMFSGLKMDAADHKAAFHIHADTSWRLYVDGALTAEVDKNNLEAPAEHVVSQSLDPGVHSVVLHLFPPRAGARAEAVRVAVRLETTAPFSWNSDAARPEKFQPVNARREARRPKHLDDLRLAMNDSTYAMAAYSLACMEQGMRDEAAWWAEAAARALPGEANLQLFAGLLTSMDPLLPDERRRDTAVAWHKAALAVKPDIVPSLLYLAETASAAGQAREAAGYIEQARAVNPGSLDVLLARAKWASRFATGATVRAAWDECARAFPNSSSVQLAVASMPQEGFLDMERRLEACRAAAAAGPASPEAALKLAEALADSGNGQEAGSVLRGAMELFAGDAAVLERLAGVYARLSLYREALLAVGDAVRLIPDEPSLWRRLGDLHMEAGDRDQAEKSWRTSLAANPGQFQLSDMLANLSGAPDSLYDEGGYDAIAMTAAADPDRYPGEVVRLLDRSVILFAEDGSYRRLTHEIDLAKTRRGGESLTGIESRGELLTARIVFPNGNTLEPEPFPGPGGLRLPVIMPGASREVKTLESVPAGPDGAPRVAPWFFQDPSGRMPLLLSEYVVRVPRNFPLVYTVRNLGNNVEFELTREGDADVYRWTARLSMPSREPDAVDISERIPSVEVGVKTTWDDVVFHELRGLEGRLTPSMRMRTLLTSLLQPTPDTRLDPEQAARAVYRYVCDNIEPAEPGAGDGTAAHIQVDRLGDRRLILLALLRAAGLDAYPAAARPGEPFMPPPNWDLPDRNMFTVPLVRLVLPGGRTHWLDARFDSLPFGKVADDLSGATVLSYLPGGPLFDTLPNLPAEESISFRERLLQLPGPNSDVVSMSGRSLRRGVEGLKRGQAFAAAEPEARKKMVLSSLYPIIPDAAVSRFEALGDDDAASSQSRYEASGKYPLEVRPDGVRAVSLCLVPPRVVSDQTRNMSGRNTTCHIKSVHLVEERNSFVIPEGAVFGRLPEPAQIPSRFGLYQLRVMRRGDNRVEVIRNYHVPAQRISPWEWGDFLRFLDRVEAAEKQWIEYSFKGTSKNL